jgi:hypothetical protein
MFDYVLESFLMVGIITASLVWYAVVAGKREDSLPK